MDTDSQQELTKQLKYVEEHIGLIHTWPPSIRHIMFKEHPTRGERMHLMLFLLGNAMPPLSGQPPQGQGHPRSQRGSHRLDSRRYLARQIAGSGTEGGL